MNKSIQKGLSLRLHPNLPQHVCAVSQWVETEEKREREGMMIRPWGGEEGWIGNREVRAQMERRRKRRRGSDGQDEIDRETICRMGLEERSQMMIKIQ